MTPLPSIQIARKEHEQDTYTKQFDRNLCQNIDRRNFLEKSLEKVYRKEKQKMH